MSVLLEAVKTYDAMDRMGKTGTLQGHAWFAPVAHNTTRADIVIVIDSNGAFVDAYVGPKDSIIIPVTERSAGRTSTGAVENPHALTDKFIYMNMDESNPTAYKAYTGQLKAWSESLYADPKAMAVLTYILGNTITGDLDAAGFKHEKNTVISWEVLGCGDISKTWEDRDLFSRWTAYYLSTRKHDEKILCMVTGEQDIPAKDCLKGVFSLGANAKLICWNKSRWAGRFRNEGDVLTVGFAAIQKSHNALKWLLSNGYILGESKVAVCWVPDSAGIIRSQDSLLGIDDEDCTPQNHSQKLSRKILGLRTIYPGNTVCTAVFEKRVPGRLALSFFSESGAGMFWDRLEKWESSHAFINNVTNSRPVWSPSVRNVVTYAIGHLNDNDVPELSKAQENFYGQLAAEMIERKSTGGWCPENIVRMLVMRFADSGCRSHLYRNRLGWIACAMIRGVRIMKYKEDIGMSLNTECKDRSYLFGRLLAVLEKAERDTFGKDEKREPNAIRMLSAFVQRPGQITKILVDKIKSAYWIKLPVGARVSYDRLIGEIMEKLGKYDAAEYGKQLSELYIPGYYAQKNALYTKSVNETDGEEAEEKE